MSHKYAFLLGREPELSLAELRSLFSGVQKEGTFAFIETEKDVLSIAESLGGTIKIGEIVGENLTRENLLKLSIDTVEGYALEGKKLRIAVDSFVPALVPLVFKIKDALKKSGKSIRVVQHDQDGRVKNATTIHEKLIQQGCELMVFAGKTGFTLAKTVWIQDIEGYSERDIGRERSMVVGMMPPKLAQIMINIATKGNKSLAIWDSFCGLGTTLIEAIHAGYTTLIGSDISTEMVEATKKNTQGSADCNVQVFQLDAKKIDTKERGEETVIVTEGMLGKNFTPSTISTQAAIQERNLLTDLYRGFLSSAYKNEKITSVVCCLPYWNIVNETIHMPDAAQLSPNWSLDTMSISGKRYIRHIRPGQCVGREILIMRRK